MHTSYGDLVEVPIAVVGNGVFMDSGVGDSGKVVDVGEGSGVKVEA
jgi:hypothetical protein